MTHTMITVQLHSKGVVLMALGALLLGVLLFMAGCIAGVQLAKQQTAGTSHLLDETHPDKDRDHEKTEHPPDRSSTAPRSL